MNRRKLTTRAFTMVELLVVIAIIGLLAAIATPAYNSMVKSTRISSAKNIVRSSLQMAQAHAAKTGKPAGLRFQFDRNGPFAGRQYVVLIERDTSSILTNSNYFSAVANVKPAVLPKGVGLISGEVSGFTPAGADNYLDEISSTTGPFPIANDNYRSCLSGATTFSIIFSPTGQMIMQKVDLGPRNYTDTVVNHQQRVELEKNTPQYNSNACKSIALLYCDRYILGGWNIDPDYTGNIPSISWCRSEPSASSFFLYETEPLQNADPASRFTGYVQNLTPTLINMYTGTIIEEQF